ncbi:MAG: hypothetical protein K8R21_06565 [Leptospira sp.]|nr:hypothetical protein [Leptospira sp.]
MHYLSIFLFLCLANFLYSQPVSRLRPIRPGWGLNFEGIMPGRNTQILSFLTLDGFRISADFFKSPKKNAGTVVIFPDLNERTFESANVLKNSLISDFNIFLIYPRGHSNSESWIVWKKFSQDLTGNERQSRKFMEDYHAIMEIIRDRKTELGLESDKLIFALGRFHSSLFISNLMEGVSGLILFSPRKSFYKSELKDFAGKIKIPILILSDKYRAIELKEFIGSFPASQVQAEFFEKCGSGISIILKRPDAMEKIKGFVAKI